MTRVGMCPECRATIALDDTPPGTRKLPADAVAEGDAA